MSKQGSKHILVVDDDPKIATLLQTYLQECGLSVTTVSNGIECLEVLAGTGDTTVFTVDAVVLDVMMPELDGFETLRAIRQTWSLPVIMLTARGDHTDRIVGLELGADDYLAKPFHPRELLARLNAIFRRIGRMENTSVDETEPSYQVRNVELFPAKRTVLLNGEDLPLTSMEFDILKILLERKGKVVTRDGMMNALKGEEWDFFDRSIDVHISHLRKKLGDGTLIKTIRGVGYVVTP